MYLLDIKDIKKKWSTDPLNIPKSSLHLFVIICRCTIAKQHLDKNTKLATDILSVRKKWAESDLFFGLAVIFWQTKNSKSFVFCCYYWEMAKIWSNW